MFKQSAWHIRCNQNIRLIINVSQSCLLYTSDAADEEDSVDLGGRRIIKKQKKKKKKNQENLRQRDKRNLPDATTTSTRKERAACDTNAKTPT